MDFNELPPDIYYQYNEMNFMEVNASICGQEGNLLFYTNGLYINDKLHHPMANGGDLNPGLYAFDMGDLGYILPQGALILKHGTIPHNYYLVHADLNYPTSQVGWHSSHLYYTHVDMELNNGLGKVVEKNKVVINDTLATGKITAVRHANGRDWWILFHKIAGANEYYRVLLNSYGLVNLGTDTTGFSIPQEGVGQSVFSPDGSIFARVNTISLSIGQYVDIFYFDRCTGLLSDHTQIHYDDNAYSAGIAISPNSRYLYVSSFLNLYQFDLQAADVAASKKKIATYDNFLDNGIPTQFYLTQLAPDGKIYINAPNGVRYLHVIHQPNLPYPECNVEQHAVHLPTRNAASMPNFPNYRLGPLDGSPCDTLGLDNIPIAKYRYDQDTADYLTVAFTDLSYYEPAVWSWDFGDNTTSQDASPVHTFPQDGSYEVCLTVSNLNGTNTYCRTLQIGTVVTQEALPKIEVTVFPNPCREGTNVILHHYLPRHASITLYSATGQRVMEHRLLTGWNSLPLEAVPPGMYFYEIREAGRKVKSGKLVRVE